MKKLVDSFFVNSVVVPKIGAELAFAQMRLDAMMGNKLIFTEASWLDNKALYWAFTHDHRNVVKEMLAKGVFEIHLFQGDGTAKSCFDTMLSKPFLHSSIEVTTTGADFDDALEQLPEKNRKFYRWAYEQACKHALLNANKAKDRSRIWQPGPFPTKPLFTVSELLEFGLSEKEAGNRTVVREKLYPERWKRYLEDYNHRFCVQHGAEKVWGIEILKQLG